MRVKTFNHNKKIIHEEININNSPLVKIFILLLNDVAIFT